MEISKALIEDLPEILELQYSAFRGEAERVGGISIQPLTQTLEEKTEEFRKSVILKATDNGKIVGSVQGRTEGGVLYIGKLMVSPERWGEGIGRRLLETLEAMFPEKVYELFTGGTNLKNIKMYEKFGYVKFKEKINNNGLKIVFLRKEVNKENRLGGGFGNSTPESLP